MIKEIFSIQNKNILVVGASSGIGKYLSDQLLALDCSVIGVGRRQVNPSFLYKQLDLSIDSSIDSLLEFIKENYAQIDGIILNMAISSPPLKSSDSSNKLQNIEAFDSILHTNLSSTYKIINKLSNLLGINSSLIFISSIGANLGFPDNPAYQASKAAIEALSRSMAIDLASKSIRSNCIRLGYFKAPMTEVSYNDMNMRKKRSERTILNRWGELDDILGPTVFLLSEASKYITGSVITVDGGWCSKGL